MKGIITIILNKPLQNLVKYNDNGKQDFIDFKLYFTRVLILNTSHNNTNT